MVDEAKATRTIDLKRTLPERAELLTPRTNQLTRESFRFLFVDGLGLPIIPLRAGTKIPVAGLDLESILAGKIPNAQTKTFFKNDGLNYGVACLNGYVVLDFDEFENYLAFFPKHEALEASTMCVLSPHSGIHVWLRSSEEVPRRIRIAENLDVLGVGGYVVGPGSVIDHKLCDPDKENCPHEGEGVYQVIDTYQVMMAQNITGGVGIFDAIASRAQELGWDANRHRRPSVKNVANGVAQGSRNEAAFAMARYLLFTLRMTHEDAFFALQTWNGRNKPPLAESELRTVLDSAGNYPKAEKPQSIKIPGGRIL